MTTTNRPWASVPAAAGAQRVPPVIELVGPAGAGKTTLARLLGERNPSWRVRPRPSRLAHLASGMLLLPSAVRLQRSAGRALWLELKRVVYLESLHRMLRGRMRDGRTTVLDEGPIYFLARLRVYGGDETGRAEFAAWWPGELRRWAAALDLVVRLDAPDSVLAARIRARPQRHRTQELSDSALGDFLVRYRAAYGDILDLLLRHGPVRAVHASTDRESITTIARRVEQAVASRVAVPR